MEVLDNNFFSCEYILFTEGLPNSKYATHKHTCKDFFFTQITPRFNVFFFFSKKLQFTLF